MVSYTSYATVVALTGTTLDQTTVELIITQAERRTASYLASKEVTLVAGDATLEVATLELVKAYLVKRGAMDLSRPNQMSMGEMTIGNNTDREYEHFMAEWEKMCDLYALEKNGNPYSETGASIESAIIRQDHIMPAMKLEQSTVPAYHDRADDYSLHDGDEV